MRLSLLTVGLATAVTRASQTVQVVKLQTECGTFYTVVFGDGCFSIAGAAQITQAQLLALNPGLDCAALPIGAGLCLGLPCAKTYVVVLGDWCAKIESDQGISETDLMSLNPGLACADIFPSQRLCIAAPATTTPGNPEPTSTPFPEPVVPTVPCKSQIAVSLGDTCYDLATKYGLQPNQFMALNENIHCDNMQPGDVACVVPTCGEIYRVQIGEWCALIEQNHQLPPGKLVELNPSLSCDSLNRISPPSNRGLRSRSSLLVTPCLRPLSSTSSTPRILERAFWVIRCSSSTPSISQISPRSISMAMESSIAPKWTPS